MHIGEELVAWQGVCMASMRKRYCQIMRDGKGFPLRFECEQNGKFRAEVAEGEWRQE